MSDIMQFLIADTFTDSLSRLELPEQKLVKTTAFDLQVDSSGNGHQFHRLDNAKDRHFWSVRVSSDIRLIVHRSNNTLLLCYVDHHDKAYAWAERRKLETHPTTGAAQMVEIRERVQEVTLPVYAVEVPQAQKAHTAKPASTKPKPPVLAHVARDTLLSHGVPEEWLADVQQATEDSLFDVTAHLPSEAAEALLELATGGTPKRPLVPEAESSPFAHPDAQRRFRIMDGAEALEMAFTYPWEKWTVFLHPAQSQLVERDYSGPARVSGSAGTGKTIVALHRAVHMVRSQPDSRVLLTTFSEPLASALHTKLARLIKTTPQLGERIEVHALNAIGERLYARSVGRAKIAKRSRVKELLKEAVAAAPAQSFRLAFLTSEWDDVVDAWQVESWEAYRDVKRLGRKTRLSEQQRKQIWEIMDALRAKLAAAKLITHAGMFQALAMSLRKATRPPFDAVVVDECQDLSVTQLRFLASLGGGRTNGLFFAGDLGQRIFQLPFSWKALGVELRGRAFTLRINYRTSHQIRQQADRLLGPEISDVDGISEDRRGAQSVFNGPDPSISIHADEVAEQSAVAAWITGLIRAGMEPGEIGVFVRSEAEVPRARAALDAACVPYVTLDQRVLTVSGSASVGTMHLAKGLEFRAVVVMACDDEVLPSQQRIAEIGDDADLEEIYHTERNLLYVACTRAREQLLLTGVDPASEFLDDLKQ